MVVMAVKVKMVTVDLALSRGLATEEEKEMEKEQRDLAMMGRCQVVHQKGRKGWMEGKEEEAKEELREAVKEGRVTEEEMRE